VYLEFADKEYLATTEYLFREFDDIPGGLYLRDSTFFDPAEDPLDANGNLIFWSRGNGWVFGGLPAILRKLPATFAGRSRYVLCLRCAPGVFVHYTPGCVTCKVLV
jgi:unsaturated rhamnogalacturonyl hydrolase